LLMHNLLSLVLLQWHEWFMLFDVRRRHLGLKNSSLRCLLQKNPGRRAFHNQIKPTIQK
jgi:hypothetical protein